MAKPMEKISWQELEIGAAVSEVGNAMDYKTGSWRSLKPVVNSFSVYQVRRVLVILP